MMRPVGAGPLAVSRAVCSRFLVCRLASIGRRPLDDPEFGAGVVHFKQPFCHGLFLAFLGARHFAPLGFFQQ